MIEREQPEAKHNPQSEAKPNRIVSASLRAGAFTSYIGGVAVAGSYVVEEVPKLVHSFQSLIEDGHADYSSLESLPKLMLIFVFWVAGSSLDTIADWRYAKAHRIEEQNKK